MRKADWRIEYLWASQETVHKNPDKLIRVGKAWPKKLAEPTPNKE